MRRRRRWRWPILGVLGDTSRWLRRNWRDGDLWSVSLLLSGLWLFGVFLLACLCSTLWWPTPHTNSVQFWGAHPRPAFWILMAGAAPGACTAAWGLAAWGVPAALKVLLLFVPRREPAPRLPLKPPDEVATLERELGIANDA